MKKFHRIMTIGLLLSLLLSACAAAVPEEVPVDTPDTIATDAPATVEDTAAPEPVSIHVMTFFAYDNPEVEQSVVDAFEAAYPNITVELDLVPFMDIYTKYKTLSAGGEAPDVISMNFENLHQFAALGALESLNGFIEAEDYDMGLYYPNTVEMHKVDGDQFGLPATFSSWVLFYNKTMFDEAGEEYPSADWDWDEMVAKGSQFLSDDDDDGIMDTYGYGLAWFPWYLFLYGENVLTADNSACAMTSPGALQAIENYVAIQGEGGIVAGSEAQSAMGDWDRFIAGKLAMYPSGPWALQPFNDSITSFEWDVAHHPIGTTRGTFLFGNSYAISSGSEAKDAAWEFIKFSTGVEAATIRQEGKFEISAVQSVAEEVFLATLAGGNPANAQVFMEATEYGQLLPAHERFNEIMDAIYPELDLAVLGEKTVEQAMSDACTIIDAILAE